MLILLTITLIIRSFLYSKGLKKSVHTKVRSIAVGNLSLGGTGKTPMTELIVRTLQEDSAPDAEKVIRVEDIQYDGLFAGVGLYDGDFGGNKAPVMNVRRNIAVLSRGYRRKSKGFLYVEPEGNVAMYGDEPLQIKRKFPSVTVAVDADRVEGAEHLQNKGCDFIILDDALQFRKLIPDATILLTTYQRPYFKDILFPFGTLRDLPWRSAEMDMIVVTKCPTTLDSSERMQWASNIGLRDFDPTTCCGVNKKGKSQYLLFSTVLYDKLQPVFPEGNVRYLHAGLCILFTGIADDIQLQRWLCEKYRIISHTKYRDHHDFTRADIASITEHARRNPTAILVTTEKDAQRLKDSPYLLPDVKSRLFYAPIRTMLLSAREQEVFKQFLIKSQTI